MAGRPAVLRRRLLALALLGPVTAALGGCKVISLQADQEARDRRSGRLDAQAYVGRLWTDRVLPYLDANAAPMPELNRALAANLDRAGAARGRRAADSSPWTFATKGVGTVIVVDRTSRTGRVELVADGAGPIVLQTGPVVVDTAVRDRLPFLSFNDFADQIAFAAVGSALTRRALDDTRPVFSTLKPGDRVEFLAVFNLAAVGDPIVATPVRLRALPRTSA